MKIIIKSLLISILATVAVTAHPSYSEGRKVNESLAKELSSIYDVKLIETDTFVEAKIGDCTVARTAYFYPWKGSLFSEKNEEDLIERLNPWIESLERKYGIWCQFRGFMFAKHADEYSPTEISGLNLKFKNRDTKEVHLHLMISIFHTSPEILAVEATSIFPQEILIEQASAGQHATRSESDSEGDDKPQPESEGRSR